MAESRPDPEKLYMTAPPGVGDEYLAAVRRIQERFPGGTRLILVVGRRRLDLGEDARVEGGNDWCRALLGELAHSRPGDRGLKEEYAEPGGGG